MIMGQMEGMGWDGTGIVYDGMGWDDKGLYGMIWDGIVEYGNMLLAWIGFRTEQFKKM